MYIISHIVPYAHVTFPIPLWVFLTNLVPVSTVMTESIFLLVPSQPGSYIFLQEYEHL